MHFSFLKRLVFLSLGFFYALPVFAQLMPGDQFAAEQDGVRQTYTLEKFLGGGAMGEVYLATLEAENGQKQKVALKFFTPLAHSNAYINRYKIAHSLAVEDKVPILKTSDPILTVPMKRRYPKNPQVRPVDPNGTTVLGEAPTSAQVDLSVAVTMELATDSLDNNLSLTKLDNLDKGSAKQLEAALRQVESLVADLSETLAKLGDAGYTHNDIKPANIVLLKEGERLRFYLADFDLLAPINVRHSSGTEPYVPPEAYSASFRTTIERDFYASAVTIFQAILGVKHMHGVLPDNVDEAHDFIRKNMERLRVRIANEFPELAQRFKAVHDFVTAGTQSDPVIRREGLQRLLPNNALAQAFTKSQEAPTKSGITPVSCANSNRAYQFSAADAVFANLPTSFMRN